MITCLRAALLLSGLLAGAAYAGTEDAILRIDQTSGVTGVQRDGKRLPLQAGDALQEQDLIVTESSGRMTLRLGRHGFVEVGPDAEVGVERLPFATYARDLKSIFSVAKGYFRVVWRQPQLTSSWPLYIYLSGHRISLASGEYFFQNRGEQQGICVAAGQLTLQAVGREGMEIILPPACLRLTPAAAPQLSTRNPDDWIAVRRGYRIDATATSLQAEELAIAAAAAAASSTAAAVSSNGPSVSMRSVAAPTAVVVSPVVQAASVPPRLPPPAAAPTGLAAPAAAAASKTLAPPAPASANSQWVLNVASYTEAAVAEKEAARLRAAGYPSASSQPVSINGKSWYRVQLVGFTSEAAARAALVEIKGKLGLRNIWVRKL